MRLLVIPVPFDYKHHVETYWQFLYECLNRGSRILICLTWIPASAGMTLADPLNMTISGKNSEKVPLETLVPSPDIPAADAMSLSLDGGKSAADREVEPLLSSDAVLYTDSTKLPMPSFSAISDAPFITQALPIELERQRDNKLKKREPRLRFTHWQFSVVDELNQTVHQDEGEGYPPTPLTWDGTKDGQFVLEPDRTYFSYLKLTAHGEPDRTIVGDSVRFLAFIRQNGNDTEIRFGERVYEKDGATFSAESKIYINDLEQRLSQLIAFYKDATVQEGRWHVTLSEPKERTELAERRKALWQATLQKALGRNMPDEHFSIKPIDGIEASVSIVFPRAKPPLTDMALRGQAKASLDLNMEGMDSLIRISEKKDTVIVDLRHDRLFMPGTAYLKDSAMPYLTRAMATVREKMGTSQKDTRTMKELGENQRDSKKEGPQKKLLLRSYTQKLPDNQKEREDDPQLTATRSKVLFMLFAREGLAP